MFPTDVPRDHAIKSDNVVEPRPNLLRRTFQRFRRILRQTNRPIPPQGEAGSSGATLHEGKNCL